jgi:hypothetical protein
MQCRDLNFRQLETLKNYLVNVVNAGWTIDGSSLSSQNGINKLSRFFKMLAILMKNQFPVDEILSDIIIQLVQKFRM